ncbi:unnamed protein product, partial [Sphenostylis stenocarpa]
GLKHNGSRSDGGQGSEKGCGGGDHDEDSWLKGEREGEKRVASLKGKSESAGRRGCGEALRRVEAGARFKLGHGGYAGG